MSKGIHTTLLTKLFTQPAPEHKEDFILLRKRMFPSSHYFESFLEERQFERQVEMAKTILLRLGFEHLQAPPNKWIYNLLEFESRLAGTSPRTDFVGRDHFVHLVNLYLLGLYIFWYHGRMRTLVTEQFKDMLRGSAKDSAEHGFPATRHACEVFLISWQRFILFHDLGYPFEMHGSSASGASSLQALTDQKYHTKELVLRLLAQFMAVGFGLNKSNETDHRPVLSQALRPLISKTRQGPGDFQPQFDLGLQEWTLEEVEAKYGSSVRLRWDNDPDAVKFISGLVPADHIFHVLEIHEKPSLLVFGRNVLALSQRGVRGSEDDDELVAWAAKGFIPKDRAGVWKWTHYVCQLEKHLEERLGAFWSSPFLKPEGRKPELLREQLSRFIRLFLENTDATGAHFGDLSFGDLSFGFYMQLLREKGFDEEPNETDPFSHVKSAQRSAVRGLRREIVQEVTGQVAREIEAATKMERVAASLNDFENGDSPHEKLLEAVERLLEPLNDTKALAEKIKKKLAETLVQRVTWERSINDFYFTPKHAIRRCVEGLKTAALFQFKPAGRAGGKKKPPALAGIDWDAFSSIPLAAVLDDLFKKRRLGTSKSLEKYKPSWLAKSADKAAPPQVDHGISSGILFAMSDSLVSSFQGGNEASSALMRYLKQYLRPSQHEDSPQIRAEVLYAILIHNMYPAEFESSCGKRLLTGVEDSAFTYFCLLCDSLQPWDRKKLANPGIQELPYNPNADEFDVHIHGNIIRITEQSDHLKLSAREEALRKHLDQYLKGASSMIRLTIGEWKHGREPA